ncbi:MAG: hypothetical protein ACRDYB_13205 [Acidimicrobiales bacterium]
MRLARYVVADDLDQAREDLTRDWATRRTPTWAIDTALPAQDQPRTDPHAAKHQGPAGIVALRHARDRLLARATRPGAPPTPTKQAQTARAALAEARGRLADLSGKPGGYATGPIGDATRHANAAGARLARLEHLAANGGWRERRQAHHDLPGATAAAADTEDRLARLVDAERNRLHQQIGWLRTAVEDHDHRAATAQQRWQHATSQHGLAARAERRLRGSLETARRRLEQPDRPERATPHQRTPGNRQPTPGQIVQPQPPTATQDAPGL